MTFYEILEHGKMLTVDTTGTDYTPTDFYLKDGALWVRNKDLGNFPHPTFTKEDFNNHIMEMIKKGFNIITTNL